jgi:hypothetical protein
LMGRMHTVFAQSAKNRIPGAIAPGKKYENLVISFSYDGSFLVSFYACASQFYDAFFFYHKAYFVNVLFL